MKKLLAAGALALTFAAGSAQAITTVNFAAGSGSLPANTNIIQNFESFTSGASIGPNAIATSVSPTALSIRPAFGSTGNYGVISDRGSYSISFIESSIFSFVVGSLDAFNQLTLRYADGSSTVYNGGAIINDPTFDAGSGNRTAADNNGVVTYTVTSGPLITGVVFGSTGVGNNSFEIDNLSIGGSVPEPAAWGMMILGFGLVGGVMRRRTAKVSFAA